MHHLNKKDRTPLVVRWLITYGPDGTPDGGLWGGRPDEREPSPRVDPARRAREVMVGLAVVTIAAAVLSVLVG